MSGAMYGADVPELERLAAEFRRAADDLDEEGRVLTGILNRVSWLGDVATRYLERWNGVQIPRIGLSTEFLRQAADQLEANAREQRDASMDGGSLPGVAPGVANTGQLGASVKPPCTTDPAEIAKWWDSLTDAERSELIDTRGEMLGNMEGLPPSVRDQVNRVRVAQFLDSVDSGSHEGLRQVLADDSAQILMFDPAGDGRVAVAYGDLATARDITTVVPGIGTDLENFGPGHAQRLHQASGPGAATVYWLGYDTPSGLEPETLSDHSLLRTDRAVEQAASLVSFTEGLRVTTSGSINVVAHSYGTVLTTEAAKVGLDVERVVLVGSPGVPAETAAVFGNAEVYAVTNPTDPISYATLGGEALGEVAGAAARSIPIVGIGPMFYAASQHLSDAVNQLTDQVATTGAGVNPISDGFGATVLGNNGMVAPLESHDSYFDSGSPALKNIAEVITSPPAV